MLRNTYLSVIMFGSSLMFASSALAQNGPTLTSVANGVGAQPLPSLSHHYTTGQDLNSRRILDGSETASFFFRKGVRAFEKDDLDKAEQAFRASLRADGLDALSLHYLVIINDRQGDQNEALRYAKAYEAQTKR
ncbi:MAG: hypothetical protein AAFP97_03430 [Pseudomonadota bacterium]